MDILVIGNGFDIAHQLPTSYSEFLHFVGAFCKYNLDPGSSKTIYDVFFSDWDDSIYLEFLDLVKQNKWIEFFQTKLETLENQKKKGWIDFEKEISVIIRTFDKAREELIINVGETEKAYRFDKNCFTLLKPFLEFDYEDLCQTQKPYTLKQIDEITQELLYQLRKLIRALEIYLSSYVVSVCEKKPIGFESLSINRVLSFNYTDTFENLYDSKEKDIRYCYVHGKAELKHSLDECELVLGIDEYLPEDKKDSQNNFAWFKKFFQRIFNGTDSSYMNWIEELSSEKRTTSVIHPNHLYIYGHSLDVTDKDILSRFILARNTNTYIFYHNRESLANLINNLIKVIGEDELIKRTGGSNKTISFVATDSLRRDAI